MPDFVSDRVWTPADLDDLPEELDWRRFEIVDGSLVVGPHATPRHDLIVARLIVSLSGCVPSGYSVIGSSMIDLRPSYRIPDLLVLADSAFRHDAGTAVSPSDVLLAVEIESPRSLATDRITKPAQYAAAGIAHFWRVEMDPLRLHVYRLGGDVYEQSEQWNANETARITDPFIVAIDLSALLPGDVRP